MLKINKLGVEFLNKITPTGLPNVLNNYHCSTCVFKKSLYFSIGYSDNDNFCRHIKVLRYQPQLNQWAEVYYEVLNSQENDENQIAANKLTVTLSTSVQNQGNKNVLIMIISSAAGVKILYSSDGEHYEHSFTQTVANNLDVHEFVSINKNLYVLGSKNISDNNSKSCIFKTESLASENWQEIDHQMIFADKNNIDISSLVNLNNSLVVATVNKKMGFQLWTYKDTEQNANTWEISLTNGAYRFAHNQEIYAMTVFNSDLYIVSGIAPDVESIAKDWYLNSFELTRLYANNDWDLISGIIRCSPNGLRFPLSGTGLSFDMGSGAVFQCLVAHDQHLYLGVNNEEGFQLWSSQDGENWLLFPPNELTNYYQAKILEAVSTVFGLLFVLEVTELNGEKHLQMWLAQ